MFDLIPDNPWLRKKTPVCGSGRRNFLLGNSTIAPHAIITGDHGIKLLLDRPLFRDDCPKVRMLDS
jgi:hypothetical protein